MFKGMDLEDFNRSFKTEDDCRQYLYNLKWKEKYVCARCGNSKFWKGRTWFHTRCSKCRFDESVTANTLFHKTQMPLLKAFSIAFHIGILKNGISTVTLGKMFSLNQKTAWLFKRKVQEAMGTTFPDEQWAIVNTRFSKIDSIVLTQRGENLSSLQRVSVKIEKKRCARKKKEIITCKPTVEEGAVELCELLAGRYVGENKSVIFYNFKHWITGTHHHCSDKYLKGYVDEFFFKLNFCHQENMLWHRIIEAMICSKPYFIARMRRKRINVGGLKTGR